MYPQTIVVIDLNNIAYINDNYGREYIGYVKTSNKTENVQDAHEAIRPTSILREPVKVKQYLSNDEFKLYSLIYKRTLAALMSDAKVNQTTIIFDNKDYKFKASGQIMIFDGYLKVYQDYETSEDKILPELSEGEKCITADVLSEQHFTKPPARYTEAKLIKEMEDLGIGRPSTYAKTIDTLKERNYVEMEDKKFKPTTIGIETTDKLQEFFSDLINVEYTRDMEEELEIFNKSAEKIFGEDSTCMYYNPLRIVQSLIINVLQNEFNETKEGAEWFVYEGFFQIENGGTSIEENGKIWNIKNIKDYYDYLVSLQK